jgi:hypothetical protein
MSIAAHTFSAGPEPLNKPHWAHQGNLIERELEEIQAEAQRLWSLVVGAATGNGPAAAPAGTEPSADEIAAMEAA